jgi:hypothetical protein
VIYLDCDGPHCLDRIKQRYPYPTLVVRTSRARYQVYWRLDQPVSITQQEQLMSAMAMDVDADRAATDVSRVLRLPSFWNRKPGRDNTVDIVFIRDHAVPYRSLSERRQPSACRDCVPKTLTSTDSNRPLVLGGSKGRDSKSTRALSESERDWYQVHRQLALGRAPQDVVYWLQGKRMDKPNPVVVQRDVECGRAGWRVAIGRLKAVVVRISPCGWDAGNLTRAPRFGALGIPFALVGGFRRVRAFMALLTVSFA